MSSRERWIIYPLLFFAFCLAARDQLPYLRPRDVKISDLTCNAIKAQQIEGDIMVAGDFTGTTIEGKKRLEADIIRVNDLDTGTLKCEQIEVVSPDGQPVAQIRPTDSGAGQLTLFCPGEQPDVVLSNGDGTVLLKSAHADGSQFVLTAAPGGGTLVVLDAENREIGRYPLKLEAASAAKPDDDVPDEAPAELGEPS